MRIIGGELGGRRVNPPAKMPYTPTTDIAKEGLFNILENNLDLSTLRTLDLFGGTGSISYELASRGVKDLTVVEKDPVMFAFIQKTSKELGLSTGYKVVRMDVFKFLGQCTETFDVIFAGPPYALETIDELPKLVVSRKLLTEGGWFVLEHTPRNNYEDYPLYVTQRHYGTTIFSIFVNRKAEQ
jgi:16S rRNA (guanine966-N2)-methyltransferase